MADGGFEAVLRRVVEVDPITRSSEGIDDGCLWCGVPPRWRQTVHQPSCAWVAGRLALGLPLTGRLGDEHVVAVAEYELW